MMISVQEYKSLMSKEKPKKKKAVHQFRPQKTITDQLLTTMFMYNPVTMLFIPGNMPSSKNGKEISINKKTNRLFVRNNDLVLEYKKFAGAYMLQQKPKWKELTRHIEYPISCGLHFVRNSRREFDFNNASQLLADMMKEYGWIPDDNIDIIYFTPIYISGEKNYSLSRDYSCTIIYPVESYVR